MENDADWVMEGGWEAEGRHVGMGWTKRGQTVRATHPLVAVGIHDVVPVVGVHGVRHHESRHPFRAVTPALRHHPRHLKCNQHDVIHTEMQCIHVPSPSRLRRHHNDVIHTEMQCNAYSVVHSLPSTLLTSSLEASSL